MYITKVAHYIPENSIKNDYFTSRLDITNEWIVERTGILERRRASAKENTHTMGIRAIENLPEGYPLDDIDLIIGATYTPADTIVTLAHKIQHYLKIPDIPTLTITAACSSFVNACEIVEGYFAMGKATKALVIASEHNSRYSNDEDPKTGPLWGDGAVATILTKTKESNSLQVISIKTAGAATTGKAMYGVCLDPKQGLTMPNGKDVFIQACQKMSSITLDILSQNGYNLNDLDYLVPHQANKRITNKLRTTLGLNDSSCLSNIEYLGNTGSAGSVIALSEHMDKYDDGCLIVIPVFGGGYSYGALLLKKVL